MEKEINQKNEIISVLNNIRLKHLSVIIKEKSKKTILSGFITKADTNSFTVFYDNIHDIVPIKKLNVCFDYNRSYFTSDEIAIRLLNIQLKSVELFIPEKLFFHSVRKYARIDIPDSIQVNIKKVENVSFERSSNMNIDELPATLKNIYLELEVPAPDMKKIISMVGDELGQYTNRFRINLFKEVTNLSPIEKVVNHYKKTFWIGDTDNLNNYIHIGDKYSIIGYEKYFELIKKSMTPEIMEQIRQNYLSRGINSYAMVPIIVGDRVVGVIEVSVPEDTKYKKLTIYEVFYIKGLADILGEVVVKSKGVMPDSDTNLKIIDFSIGGILANTKNVYLTHSIRENSIVLLGLALDKKEIEIRARVVRYHYIMGENAGLNMAFEFIIDKDSERNDLNGFVKKYIKITSETKDKINEK